MPKARLLSILNISATFIGTVVGAGFASGQEVLRFFGRYEVWGLFGVGVSAMLFILFGYILLFLGYSKGWDSYNELMTDLFGKGIGTAIDFILTIFLFGLSSVMAAGAGAVFYQYAHIPKAFGIGLTLLLAYIVVKSGLKRITGINILVVPLLIIFIFGVAFLTTNGNEIAKLPKTGGPLATNWLVSSVLYVSYNIALALGIILPLGKQANNKTEIIMGAVLGGVILGLLLLAIDLSLLSMPKSYLKSEIPLLRTVTNYWLFKVTFAFVLWAEIFTTLISTSFAFLHRIAKLYSNKYCYLFFWIAIFFFSQVGFSKLIGILYPFFGFVCLAILIKLILRIRRTN